MFTYLLTGSFGEYFPFLRAGGILYIYNALAWRHWYFFSKILFRFLHPESWPEIRPTVHGDISVQNWFSFTLFPLTERRCHFRFRVLANHFASFFFPVRRLLRTTICPIYPFFASDYNMSNISLLYPFGQRVQTSVGFHSDPHSLLSPTGHLKLTYITNTLFNGQPLVAC